jgi:hypothetical protein
MIASASRRSPVFQWLDEHYLDIIEGRGERLVISWVELAAYMTANAILDGEGKPPTPKRLALTWQAVKQSREGRAAGKRPRGRPAKNDRPQSTDLVVGQGTAGDQALAVAPPSSSSAQPAPASDSLPPFKPRPMKRETWEEQVARNQVRLRAQDAWVGDLSAAERAREESDRRAAIENARAEGENKI